MDDHADDSLGIDSILYLPSRLRIEYIRWTQSQLVCGSGMKDLEEYRREVALLQQVIELQKKVIEDGIDQHKTMSALVKNTGGSTEVSWYQDEIKHLRDELTEEREMRKQQQLTLDHLFKSIVNNFPLLTQDERDIGPPSSDDHLDEADYADYEESRFEVDPPVVDTKPGREAESHTKVESSVKKPVNNQPKCPVCWAKLDGESQCFSCGTPINYDSL